MRVGLVTPRYPPTMHGGGEVSAQLLAEHLADHDRTEVTVYSFDGVARESVNGVPVRRLGSPPHVVPELTNLYAAGVFEFRADSIFDCDVVHAYNMALNPTVGFLSDRHAVPSVATLNSYDILPKRVFGVEPSGARRAYELLSMPTTGRLIRHYTKRIDRFITLSEASRRVYQENGFAGLPFTVVPNMTDPSFEPLERQETGSGYSLLYVGSLIKEKGVDVLVDAMAELPDDVVLRVVGDGDQLDALCARSRRQGVADRVRFEGRVPYERVKQYYATSDLFVHPGVWPEPFGRTIIEAMEAGLPVVVTNIGGPAEIVPDERFRCQPGSSADLAAAIGRVRATDEDIAAQNRELVQTKYAPERIVERMLETYQRTIDDHTA